MVKIGLQFNNNKIPCRSNTAYVIGGTNRAAKRRIQRKSLHSCYSKSVQAPDQEPTPVPTPEPEPES